MEEPKNETLFSEEFLTKIAGLPARPGVYLHKDADGGILYVGKAKNLRSRVRSYAQAGKPVDAKTRALIKKIADTEVIVTDTEVEALILENTLIKEHRPKYNILLKDDKSYPYIRVTKEEFPRIFKTRRVIRDGSKYFGPYTDGTYLYNLLKALRSIFPLRSCDLALTEKTVQDGRWKVCLDYHIKKCEGPCEGHVSRNRYADHIRQAQLVLSGRTTAIENQLEQRMNELADELRFEDAAVLRGRLSSLRDYTAKQRVLAGDQADRDVFALSRSESQACSVIFTIRDGKLVGKRHFLLTSVGEQSDSELLQVTLERWYVEAEVFPDEVLLSAEIEHSDLLKEFLREKKGRIVEVIVPKIGDKRKLVEMAVSNADILLREVIMQAAQKDQTLPRAVMALQSELRMERMPRRIECFDNSHIQGTDYVSSMVVFIDGKPKKSEYRHYKLRSVEGSDDFEAMKEVLSRRFAPDKSGTTQLPDLVVIDGGKGQLSHAMEVLDELGLRGAFTVVGLAKRLEEIFMPGSSLPLYVAKTSPGLRLLQQTRDEAHRFAVRYHRTLRTNRTLATELTEIPGIGDKKARLLLTKLGSVDAVQLASSSELSAIVGLSAAAQIVDYFQAKKSDLKT